jgi:hypothetical protein
MSQHEAILHAMAAIRWSLVNDGECLGDHPLKRALFSQTLDALSAALETPSSERPSIDEIGRQVLAEAKAELALADELEALHAKATAGPWAWDQRGEKINEWGLGIAMKADEQPYVGHFKDEDALYVEYVCSHEAATCNYSDPALICAVRNNLPTIIAALRAIPSAIRPSVPDVELLLDNAATASQVRELLRKDDGEETVLREAVRLNVYEPLARLLGVTDGATK